MIPIPSIRKTGNSVLLYAAMAFIAFMPCLLFKQAYFQNDLLYQFGPWRIFLKDELADGHFPLWNPYLLGGQPFFADLQNMMLYPFNYLTLPFSIPFGFTVFFFLHMLWAALGMHFLLKSLRLSETACRIGAIMYSLSGDFWWEMIHPTIIASLAWLPWFLLCLENLSRDWKTRQAFVAGLCFSMIFCCGNFQITSTAAYGGLLYFIFRFTHWSQLESLWRNRLSLKKITLIALFCLWGSFPLLGCLIPANEFSSYSTRRTSDQTYDNFNGTFCMIPKTTYEFLFPSLGIPEGKTPEMANQEITDTQYYCNALMGDYGFLGVWIPFLVYFAFKHRERKFAIFLLICASLSVLTAWGRFFPLHRLLCLILPGINLSRASFRFIDIYVVSVCVLAAYGYQMLDRLFAEEKRKPFSLLLGAVGYVGLLGVVSLIQPSQTWREILGLGIGFTGIFLWGGTTTWQKVGKILFQAALILPLFLTAWNDFGTGPSSNFDYNSRFPSLELLGKTFPDARFFINSQDISYPLTENGKSFNQYLPENSADVFRFRTTAGYNPLLLKKSSDLKKLPQNTYVQLMGVRGILTGQYAGEQKGFTHQSFDTLHLYEFMEAPEFVKTPYQIQVIPDGKERLKAMGNPRFQPKDEVVLSESLPSSILSQLPGKKSGLKYQLEKDDPDEQVFEIQLELNSLLVFSEIAFPGWKVWVDGKPTELFTADHSFRALFASSGNHKVEFKYEPSWAKPLLIGLLSWLISAFIFIFYLSRKKQDPSVSPAHA